MSEVFDVVFISLYPSGPHRHAGRSGVASYTANLADGLTAAGARVCVIAPEDDGEQSDAADGDVVIRRAFRRGPRAYVDAAREAAKIDAPVVHVQFETFLLGGPTSLLGLIPALAMLSRSGRRVIVTLHHVVDPSQVDREFVRLHRVKAPALLARAGLASVQRAIARVADVAIVHEPAFAGSVGGAVVVPHGVEVLGEPDRLQAQSAVGLGAKPIVLCFGFVAPYKGLEAALEAARLGQGAYDLVIAGGEHPRLHRREGYAERLRSTYAGVAHFTGYVPEPEVADWFGAADVVLFPYPSPFSSSGALALALAYGKPVLLSPPLAACMDAPEALAVSCDPAQMAGRLVQLFEEPERLRDVELTSRTLQQERSWAHIARRHLDLYEGTEGVNDAQRAGRRSVRTG